MFRTRKELKKVNAEYEKLMSEYLDLHVKYSDVAMDNIYLLAGNPSREPLKDENGNAVYYTTSSNPELRRIVIEKEENTCEQK